MGILSAFDYLKSFSEKIEQGKKGENFQSDLKQKNNKIAKWLFLHMSDFSTIPFYLERDIRTGIQLPLFP